MRTQFKFWRALALVFLLATFWTLFAKAQSPLPWRGLATHDNRVDGDSVAFLAGGTYPADTSAIYDIGYCRSLSMMLAWAGFHATDSSTFRLVFQVSNGHISPATSILTDLPRADTGYYNWKTVGAAVACSTVIGGGSPVGTGIKVAYLPCDSIGNAAGAGGAVTSALHAAIGAKYFRYILIQTQDHTSPSANIDSAWVATLLMRQE